MATQRLLHWYRRRFWEWLRLMGHARPDVFGQLMQMRTYAGCNREICRCQRARTRHYVLIARPASWFCW